MKNLIWILTALFLVTACSREEPAEPVTEEEPAAIEVPAAEETEEPTAAEEDADEAVEIVEETAAEPEPEEEAIVLEPPDAPVAPAEWKYKEGQHYARIVPTQPTLGGADKIEVAEFFFYSCPHCNDFEPIIKGWSENKPANVRFVQIPATWNNLLMLHAQMYYTHEVLARNGALADGEGFHAAVYTEIHRRGNRLASESSIRALFGRFGVSAEDFDRTWSSFEVAQKIRVAQDLMRRYGISSTPMMVVNGKYRTGGAEAGGYSNLLELLDELVVRESLR
ncbi:MAG: thioredoxin domain-containing protein [Woeseiaceae bacterium]|nr:thioredoxin domain-containing protein [Woeseiaceae bacterium]